MRIRIPNTAIGKRHGFQRQRLRRYVLKGPKREIFGLGIFAQIRPIWICDLGTRPKNPKKLGLGP